MEVNFVFYDRFLELCAEKGVKPTRACTESGLSRGLAAKWKATGTEKPSADALEKMSAYFGKSIEEILSGETKKAPTPEGERKISDDDIMFALWGDSDDVDKDDLDDVKRYAAFVQERKKQK